MVWHVQILHLCRFMWFGKNNFIFCSQGVWPYFFLFPILVFQDKYVCKLVQVGIFSVSLVWLIFKKLCYWFIFDLLTIAEYSIACLFIFHEFELRNNLNGQNSSIFCSWSIHLKKQIMSHVYKKNHDNFHCTQLGPQMYFISLTKNI